jgi:ketosteroid isomerase-like protein
MRFSSMQVLAMAILVIAGMASQTPVRAAQQDDEAVQLATAQFYAALNAMFVGEVEPMDASWSHTDDVTYMGPDGKFIVGWEEVSVSWKRQAAMKLGGTIRSEALRVTVGKDLAVVACLEVGENVVDGTPQTVSLRATNIFRKEDGQWKMIGHHTDILPFLQK